MWMLPLSNGKNQRGTKEPLDKGEGGEWKSQLKNKHWKNQDHGFWSHYCMANRRGKDGNSDRFPLLGLKNHCRWWLQPWNQKTIASWQESDDKPRQCVENQRHYFADKGPYSQGYGLPTGHIWLWELEHKGGRTPKNWCLQAVVLEKTPESQTSQS